MTIATETLEATNTLAESSASCRLYRLSVAQYEKMTGLGIFGPADKVELLEGLIVSKMGKNPPHIVAGKNTHFLLIAAVPPGWHVSKEDPVVAFESVPEPDCAVLRGAPRDYSHRLPQPGEAALVVEVSDSSLQFDLTVKRRIYAAASIPFYWVVNIPDHRLEVFSDPTGPAEAAEYQNHVILGPDDSVPLVIDGLEVARIAVRDLLP